MEELLNLVFYLLWIPTMGILLARSAGGFKNHRIISRLAIDLLIIAQIALLFIEMSVYG